VVSSISIAASYIGNENFQSFSDTNFYVHQNDYYHRNSEPARMRVFLFGNAEKYYMKRGRPLRRRDCHSEDTFL
jgi:hypothetical protein